MEQRRKAVRFTKPSQFWARWEPHFIFTASDFDASYLHDLEEVAEVHMPGLHEGNRPCTLVSRLLQIPCFFPLTY